MAGLLRPGSGVRGPGKDKVFGCRQESMERNTHRTRVTGPERASGRSSRGVPEGCQEPELSEEDGFRPSGCALTTPKAASSGAAGAVRCPIRQCSVRSSARALPASAKLGAAAALARWIRASATLPFWW